MRVNKVITMTPAYHKWASSQPNFSEWVQKRIDEWETRAHSYYLQDAPINIICNVMRQRLVKGERVTHQELWSLFCDTLDEVRQEEEE